MQFTRITSESVQQAADLVVSNYAQISPEHPALKPDAFSVQQVAGDLIDWADNGASVVAHVDGMVRGFIVGRFINFYQSNKALFSPDWGHAVVDRNPDRVLNEMYAWLTRSGQVDGSDVHAFSVFAADSAMKSALSNLEFGVHMMEGVLDLPTTSELTKNIDGIKIRAATAADIPQIIELDKQLWAHLALPPVQLGLLIENYPKNNPKYRLPREGSHISVAETADRLVGFISSQIGIQEFTAMRDPRIPAINGAFVEESHRNSDIAQALLNDTIRYAKSISAPYVTVDFESINVEGSGFWRSRDFTALGYGMTRRIPV